jgi:excisionase family DNA binding protein
MDPNQINAIAHPRPVDGMPTNSDWAIGMWTPKLGPTAMLLAHRLAGDVINGGPTTYRLDRLARNLGVGEAKVTASLKRLHRCDVALVGDGVVAIRLTLDEPHSTQPSPVRGEAMTLTVPEAADILGISRAAAYQAAREGSIPTVRIGRRLIVPRQRLMEMLEP